jgi:hypothetical protein
VTVRLSRRRDQHVTTQARWPVRRSPPWLFAAIAVGLAAAVLVGLAHHPTTGQRAADLRGMIRTLNFDIRSCAGGLRDSLTALDAIQSGSESDRATAVSIARDGAANCSPANNQQLADLVQYQVPESLTRFHLKPTVNELVTWAFPWAQRAQHDIVNVLVAGGAQARERASAVLRSDLRTLDAHKAAVDNALNGAARALGSTDTPPVLPR